MSDKKYDEAKLSEMGITYLLEHPKSILSHIRN
jgi:hypothetical protein